MRLLFIILLTLSTVSGYGQCQWDRFKKATDDTTPEGRALTDAIDNDPTIIDNWDKLDKAGVRDMEVGYGKVQGTPGEQKWFDDLKDGVYRNGTKAEYANPNGKVIKWSDQTPADIDNSIQTKLNLPDTPKNAGFRTEGKVGDFLQSEGKQLEGAGLGIKRANGTDATDLDLVTKNEIIEVKNSIGAAKDKFVLIKDNGDVGQAGRLVNKNADDFVNPHGKQPILYIDNPLPRDANGNLFPSDQAYVDALKAEGIEVANSLDDLKNLIQ